MKKVLFTAFLVSFFIGTTVISSLAAAERDAHQSGDMMNSQEMGMDRRPCINDSYSGFSSRGMGEGMGAGNMGRMMGQGMNHMSGAGGMGSMMGMGMNQMMGAGNMRHMFFLDRADELKLSADQVSKLKSLYVTSRTDSIRNTAEAKIARLDLSDLLSGKNWTMKDAEPLVRKIQKLEGDNQIRHLQAVSDARKVLTADQLKQASTNGDSDDLEGLFE